MTEGRTRLESSLADGAELSVEVTGGPDPAQTVQRAMAAAKLELQTPRDEVSFEGSVYANIVGQSEPMSALFRMLERIKSSDATVLVLGENGTGKELVARAIHSESKRAKKAFVATNCSAFNDNLLESELFGHRRGAFTGAVADKPGLFSVADKGTFFMDEVGDMSPALQVKLLRVLQEGTFMPVGGTEYKHVDVRIVAATNRDLATMVREGAFREDLYYRLNVVSLRVPPLRERIEDLPILVDFFLGRLMKREQLRKTLTPRAIAQLMLHRWPGNVRELENEIERVWVLSGQDVVIDEDVLSPSVRRAVAKDAVVANVGAAPVGAPSGSPLESLPQSTLPEAVEALERQMIARELERNQGNKTRTAEALGISRRNLIRKVQSYGLDSANRRS